MSNPATPADAADAKAILRARDFWGSLTLIATAVFFLWRTTHIPLFGDNRAGVSGTDWFNSPAVVPYGIFTAMLVLSVVLLFISIRDGGARRALSAVGIGWNPAEALRITTIAVCLFFYIFGLVPRVDFILCSGLLITTFIHGYHQGQIRRMLLAAACLGVAGLYAMVAHWPQAEWGKPHDDDWVTLAIWIGLTVWISLRGPGGPVQRAIPFIAVLAPLILVCAMAFGFRQNVPNRGGLLFSQIEYQYYVTLKPLWSR